ncbi:hypothetical protein C8R43DRAFT_145962 [Mycena crocata]|nr:hypothetical protein C8R43DRAFT_145962 [Mycena crocata]
MSGQKSKQSYEPIPILLGYHKIATTRGGTRNARSHRQLFSFLLAILILWLLGLHVAQFFPTHAVRDSDELACNADDPRLKPYGDVDDAQECAEWSTSTDSNISIISFDLLHGADLLFFLSRGPVSGRFDMIRRTNYSYPGVSKFITVEVTTNEDNLDHIKACRMGNVAEMNGESYYGRSLGVHRIV